MQRFNTPTDHTTHLTSPKMSSYEDLNCPACNKTYERPMILSCGHSFCSQCLVRLNLGNRFACPKCRMPSLQPIPNLTLEKVLQELRDTHGEQGKQSAFKRSMSVVRKSFRRHKVNSEVKAMQREELRASMRKPRKLDLDALGKPPMPSSEAQAEEPKLKRNVSEGGTKFSRMSFVRRSVGKLRRIVQPPKPAAMPQLGKLSAERPSGLGNLALTEPEVLTDRPQPMANHGRVANLCRKPIEEVIVLALAAPHVRNSLVSQSLFAAGLQNVKFEEIAVKNAVHPTILRQLERADVVAAFYASDSYESTAALGGFFVPVVEQLCKNKPLLIAGITATDEGKHALKRTTSRLPRLPTAHFLSANESNLSDMISKCFGSPSSQTPSSAPAAKSSSPRKAIPIQESVLEYAEPKNDRCAIM
ncbi:zinc-binding protein A33-like protein [Aphelenchoides avenae]|nr:zinc-binding protein A33-like protein [Aphelenchus avenae]